MHGSNAAFTGVLGLRAWAGDCAGAENNYRFITEYYAFTSPLAHAFSILLCILPMRTGVLRLGVSYYRTKFKIEFRIERLFHYLVSNIFCFLSYIL